jgi:hypothetical protein
VLGPTVRLPHGALPAAEPDRVLATVLFTDIVASTEPTIEVDDSGENPQWDISAGSSQTAHGPSESALALGGRGIAVA